MINKCIPRIGEIKYYMKAKVSVERIWDSFHLAEIKELQSKQCLIVDICTLSDYPNHTKSISLWLLGGSK
jgi:hypothetical protein